MTRDGPTRAATPLLLLVAALSGSCSTLLYTNTTPFIETHIRASHDRTGVHMFKCHILYPARDILTLEPLWRVMFGEEAWNADGPGVADGSFWTDRRPEELAPEAVARGPCTMPPPQPPIRVLRVKRHGATRGFIGRDTLGRKFLFKFDHPDYPELGTTAEIVGSRLMWALGYNVPPIFLVHVGGTGDARLDGRRATASLFLSDVRGHFHFDWYRYRREIRGLRLASAWLNDTDRVGTNTLVVVEGGRAKCYLVDFNSCLGAWQGRPKAAWRGRCYAWDLGRRLLYTLWPKPSDEKPSSRAITTACAVGNLSSNLTVRTWRTQAPNTAFDRMDEADRRWMMRQLRRLKREQIEAVVKAAQLTRDEDVNRLVGLLMRRRGEMLKPGAVAAGCDNSDAEDVPTAPERVPKK